MNRPPYIPGDPTPLPLPSLDREPAMPFIDEAFEAACRRADAALTRVSFAISAAGLAWMAWNIVPALLR